MRVSMNGFPGTKGKLSLAIVAAWALMVDLEAGRVLEITGVPGTTTSTGMTVPAGATKLWLRTHALVDGTMASVRVNSGPWIPLDNSHCVVEGAGAKFNGIGGALDILCFTVPEAQLTPGVRNTFTFRYNGSPGGETAYRVLDINFLNASGQPLLTLTEPVSPYVSVIPSVKSPSFSQAAVDAQKALGEQLWSYGNLQSGWGARSIRAHCADCHTADGRDLKYFNYSSRSIQERSKFHGLSASDATAIAVYVESHTVSRLGNPWNPPYQPGPGLDAKTVAYWAAGAGLSSIVTNQAATFSAMFGGGVPAFDFSATINAREVPVQLQLPDWNTWLPKVHPLDYWGDSFLPVDAAFKRIRSTPADQFFAQIQEAWAAFRNWEMGNLRPMGSDTEDSPSYQTARYSLFRWALVRTWDGIQTQGLEESGKTMFPWPESAARTWPGTAGPAFLSAPHLSMSRTTNNGLRDGSASTFMVRSLQWYWLQLVLNDANHRRNETSPIDWPYLMGQTALMWNYDFPSEAMLTMALAKSAEAGTGDPTTPVNLYYGFSAGPRLGMLFSTPTMAQWSGFAPEFRDSVIRALLAESSRWVHGLGRNHFIGLSGEINPLETDNSPVNPVAPPWIRSHAGIIATAESLGYSPELLEELRVFARFLWPDSAW